MASESPEFTAKDVAAHRDAADAWMVIHGEGKDFYEPSRIGTKVTNRSI